MRDYIIMTDSCCDLPDALVRELDITVLPLSFNMEGKEYYNYPDNRDMDPMCSMTRSAPGSWAPPPLSAWACSRRR